MTTVLAFLAAATVTYLLRSSAVFAGSRLTSSSRLGMAIGLVSPAVLAAMIVAALSVHHGRIITPEAVEVAALVCAVVAVRRTGNVTMALVAGLPIYWVGAAAGFV